MKVCQEQRHIKELNFKGENDSKERIVANDQKDVFGVLNFNSGNITDELVSNNLLDQKIVQHIQHLISRQFHEFKKAASDKKFDA